MPARARSLLDDFERPVVVAMIAMRMVEMPIDKVVHVIAVRHDLMSASRPMHVSRLMTPAAMRRRALIGVVRVYLDRVLIDMIAVGMMEMAIMQIVGVVAVTNGGMAAAGTMPVIVIGMMWKIAVTHEAIPFGFSDFRRHARPHSRSGSGHGYRRSNR